MEGEALAGAKKNAARQGRIIVFIDESGLSERPHRVRTWSPRGQTPVLQYHFNWKTLSAIAGITLWNFYFRLYPGSVRGPQVVDFLRQLSRHLRGELLVIWDGLPCHRSRLVRQYLAGQAGRIVIEQLPAYAPELNPVEYLGGTGRTMNCPTSVRKTTLRLATMPGRLSAGCVAARPWSPPSGNKPGCSTSVTILCDTQ